MTKRCLCEKFPERTIVLPDPESAFMTNWEPGKQFVRNALTNNRFANPQPVRQLILLNDNIIPLTTAAISQLRHPTAHGHRLTINKRLYIL